MGEGKSFWSLGKWKLVEDRKKPVPVEKAVFKGVDPENSVHMTSARKALERYIEGKIERIQAKRVLTGVGMTEKAAERLLGDPNSREIEQEEKYKEKKAEGERPPEDEDSSKNSKELRAVVLPAGVGNRYNEKGEEKKFSGAIYEGSDPQLSAAISGVSKAVSEGRMNYKDGVGALEELGYGKEDAETLLDRAIMRKADEEWTEVEEEAEAA